MKKARKEIQQPAPAQRRAGCFVSPAGSGAVEGADDALAAAVEYVGVNHGR